MACLFVTRQSLQKIRDTPRKNTASCGDASSGAVLLEIMEMSQMQRHTRCTLRACVVAAVIAAAFATTTVAGDREDFNRRAAQRDVDTFRELDRNNDGRLTRDEVHGHVDLQARFDDLDIDRDGVITTAELQRYLALRYGVSL